MNGVYGYAIDLAEHLNYCAITVLAIDSTAKLVDIRKFKDVRYPAIREMLIREMFPIRPPTYICTDYTSENAFSEELEAHLNPSFMVHGSKGYDKWRYVVPMNFSTSNFKMAMKQNARMFFDNGWFQEPGAFSTPEKEALWNELKEQMYREGTEPRVGGGFKVPKPEGQDNDLIMSLEMNLMKAKDYLTQYGSTGDQVPLVVSFDHYSDIQNLPNDTDRYRETLARLTQNTSNLGTVKSVKVKLPGDSDYV